MKTKIILAVATVLLLSFTSCSYYTYYYQTGSKAQAETSPSAIKLYSGDIDKDYEILGSVAADVVGDGEAVANYLKKRAAKMGADAIIHLELTKINSFAQRTGVSGVAIKLK